jgi:ubiquinone/menaquinone biosynthesis C-methylase UbiE
MTFENQTFDMITISNTIHHFQNINPLFLEMKRVLKTDGIILISEMIRNDLTSMQQSHLLLHHFAAKLDRLKGQMHNETFTKNDLIQSLIELPNLKYEYSWILRYKHSKQNSDKEIKWLLDTVDHLTKGIVDSQLLDEAASIKEYIQMNGFESCPTLMVVIKNEITKNI